MPQSNVCRTLRTARERRGWTQQELAERAHLATKTVSTAENGGPVRRNTLKRLAEILELDFETFPIATPEEASA